jgi:hypothetical protein
LPLARRAKKKCMDNIPRQFCHFFNETSLIGSIMYKKNNVLEKYFLAIKINKMASINYF